MHDSVYESYLDRRRDTGRLRSLRPVGPAAGGRIQVGGREVINFSSNDYLDLAHHPLLIERAREWAASWGVGATASRLVSGDLEPFQRLEAKLAAGKRAPAALIMNSGFQANASILPALLDPKVLGREPLVFSDRLNHASIHHGCRAAGVRQIRFEHGDLDHLEQQLRGYARQPGPRFILSETVFSMDGDVADVPGLVDLRNRFGAFLYLDEAHATGVLGPGGFGLSAAFPGEVDLAMGTFSKALGGFGAYVGCSRSLREYLVNRATGFIYATALPPSVLGAMDAALDLLPEMEDARVALQRAAEEVRTAFRAAGLDVGHSATQIVPVVVGEDRTAMQLADALLEAGILGVGIRPPTVPEGSSRIRFSLTAAHTRADLERLTQVVPELVLERVNDDRIDR